MKPYGSVGKIDSLDTDIVFMVIAPDELGGPFPAHYKPILNVVILAGTASHLGVPKGVGDIGPVSEMGTEVEWLDE